MIPTKETEHHFQYAVNASAMAQHYLAARKFRTAEYFADVAKEHWIKVEWVNN